MQKSLIPYFLAQVKLSRLRESFKIFTLEEQLFQHESLIKCRLVLLMPRRKLQLTAWHLLLRTSQMISWRKSKWLQLFRGLSVWQLVWWNINFFYWLNMLFYYGWRFVMNCVNRIIQHRLYDQLTVLPLVKTRERDWFLKYKSMHKRCLMSTFLLHTHVYAH